MLDILSYGLELLARVMLAAPFIHSGVHSLYHKEETLSLMMTKHIPFTPVLFIMAIVLKIGGGLCLIFGFEITLFSLALAAFTLLCACLFHDFWNYKGLQRQQEIFWFSMSLGLIGGLVLLASIKMPIYL